MKFVTLRLSCFAASSAEAFTMGSTRKVITAVFIFGFPRGIEICTALLRFMYDYIKYIMLRSRKSPEMKS